MVGAAAGWSRLVAAAAMSVWTLIGDTARGPVVLALSAALSAGLWAIAARLLGSGRHTR